MTETCDHYLAEFSPEALRREQAKVSWLGQAGEDGRSDASNPGYAAVDTRSRRR